jgi:hypothetical protein
VSAVPFLSLTNTSYPFFDDQVIGGFLLASSVWNSSCIMVQRNSYVSEKFAAEKVSKRRVLFP